MSLQFQFQYSANDVYDVEQFEQELGVSLPEDYKLFLREEHGGTLKYGHYMSCPDERFGIVDIMLDDVFGLSKKSVPNYYARPLQAQHSRVRVAGGLSIIGTHVPHLEFVMSLSAKHFGYIYLWDDQGSFIPLSSHLVAKSFSEFLDKIHGTTPERVRKHLDEYRKRSQ